jgi:hypothetical protein
MLFKMNALRIVSAMRPHNIDVVQQNRCTTTLMQYTMALPGGAHDLL